MDMYYMNSCTWANYLFLRACPEIRAGHSIGDRKFSVMYTWMVGSSETASLPRKPVIGGGFGARRFQIDVMSAKQ